MMDPTIANTKTELTDEAAGAHVEKGRDLLHDSIDSCSGADSHIYKR